MKKYLIIYNPTAGKGESIRWINRLSDRIKAENGSVEIIETEYEEHGRKIAGEMSHKFDVTVSAGGDGTLNEIATGIIESGSKTSLGILPIGSGNDYYRNFADPGNLKEAIDIIVGENTKEIDVGKSADGKYLLNIASIGLDCLTVKTAQKMKKRFGGPIAYFMALIYSMFTFRRQHISIEIDGKSISADSVLLCFGKGKTYGGGIAIMPWDKDSDGMFHIVNIVDVNKFLLILLSPTIAMGRHTCIKKYVKVYMGRKIRVSSEDTFDFNLDGEIYTDKKYIEYECIARAIRVLAK